MSASDIKVEVKESNTTAQECREEKESRGSTWIFSFRKHIFYLFSFSILGVNVSNQISRWLLVHLASQLQKELNVTKEQFGFAAGYGFSIVFLIVGIIIYLLVFASHLWHPLLHKTCRILLGIAQSFCDPASLALFSHSGLSGNLLSQAHSIYSAGPYLGYGLSAAIGGGLAAKVGWRSVFKGFGVAGMVFAFPLSFFLAAKELPHFQCTEAMGLGANFRRVFVLLFSFPPRWIMPIAGGLRELGGYVCGSYIYSYLDYEFNRHNQRPYYPWLFGTLVTTCGLSSVTLGALVTRKLRVSYGNAALYVSSAGVLFSIPFICGLVYTSTIPGISRDVAFSISMICLGLSYLFAEVWGGVCSVFYNNIIDRQFSGMSFSLYFSFMTLIGASGPELVSKFPLYKNETIGDKEYMIPSRLLLTIAISTAYLLSATLWLLVAWLVAKKNREATVMNTSETELSRPKLYIAVAFCATLLLYWLCITLFSVLKL